MAGGGLGKKKRGESGASKAKSSPFRLNGGGLYPLYMRRIVGPDLASKIGRETFNPKKSVKEGK